MFLTGIYKLQFIGHHVPDSDGDVNVTSKSVYKPWSYGSGRPVKSDLSPTLL